MASYRLSPGTDTSSRAARVDRFFHIALLFMGAAALAVIDLWIIGYVAVNCLFAECFPAETLTFAFIWVALMVVMTVGTARSGAKEWQSVGPFQIILETDSITRRGGGMPTLRLRRDEVSGLVELPGAGLRVVSARKTAQIAIPEALVGYYDLKTSLAQWQTLEVAPRQWSDDAPPSGPEVTGKAETYRVLPETVQAMRRQSIRRIWMAAGKLVILLTFCLVNGIEISGASGSPQTALGLGFVGILLLIALMMVIEYRGLVRRKRHLLSLRLALDDDTLTTYADGWRVSLSRTNISGIYEDPGTGLYVGSNEKQATITVPVMLDGYSRLKESLRQWRVIEPFSSPASSANSKWVTSTIFTALMELNTVMYLVRVEWLKIALGVVLLFVAGYAVVQIVRARDLDRSGRLGLLVFVAITTLPPWILLILRGS